MGLAGGVGGGRRVPGPSLTQAAVGFGDLLGAGGPVLGFEASFLLAGTVLPLTLVYRWGGCFRGGCRCWQAGGCLAGWCWVRRWGSAWE